ncbi:MAG TPA: mannosyltransferase family protein [Polyangia bacterium]
MLARFRFPLTLWLATHVAIVGIAALSIFLWPHVYTATGSVARDLTLVDGLCPWDCRFYGSIAANGYDLPAMSNFWPMLSLYARPLVWLHLSGNAAVVIVANLASLVAYVAIYRVFELVADEEAARWGLTMFAVYPFAFFFGAGYTETLMVAAGAGGMWLALAGRHVWASVAFAAGVLARAPGTLAWLGLASVQLRDRTPWRTRAALVIPIAAAALWPLYNWIHFHDALQWLHARNLWGWHASLNVFRAMHHWRDNARMLLVYPFFALIPAAGVVGLVVERRFWPLAAFALPTFALFCVMGAYALGRYSASVWPAFLPLGVWLARRPSWRTPVIVALTLFQGFFLHLFVHAYELQ